MLTAFVKQSEIQKENWECRFEDCRYFRVTSLEDAIRHVRYLHFDHRPFVCTLWSVQVTVFQPPIDTLPSFCLLDRTVPVGSTPRLTWRTTSRTAHNGPHQNVLCPHWVYLPLLFVVSTKPIINVLVDCLVYICSSSHTLESNLIIKKWLLLRISNVPF